MYQIEQNEPSQGFKQAWMSAGKHLQNQGQGAVNWIRATLNPPMIEHLSFRIGNQLVFVFVEAAEFVFEQWKSRYLATAYKATAIPCVMPMKKHLSTVNVSNMDHPKNKAINILV